MKNLLAFLVTITVSIPSESQVLNVNENKILSGEVQFYTGIHINGAHLHLVNSKIDADAITGSGSITGDEASKLHSTEISNAIDLKMKMSANPVTEGSNELGQSKMNYEWVFGSKNLIMIRFGFSADKVVISHKGKTVKTIDLQKDEEVLIDLSELPENLQYDISVSNSNIQECFSIDK